MQAKKAANMFLIAAVMTGAIGFVASLITGQAQETSAASMFVSLAGIFLGIGFAIFIVHLSVSFWKRARKRVQEND